MARWRIFRTYTGLRYTLHSVYTKDPSCRLSNLYKCISFYFSIYINNLTWHEQRSRCKWDFYGSHACGLGFRLPKWIKLFELPGNSVIWLGKITCCLFSCFVWGSQLWLGHVYEITFWAMLITCLRKGIMSFIVWFHVII